MGEIRNQPFPVTIDLDRERFDKVEKCLIDFLPCYARLSSGHGMHILKLCFDEETYKKALLLRNKYDDPERQVIDKIRTEHGLTGNLLLGIKGFRNERKIAGKWIKIENKEDVKKFMEVLK